MNWIYFMYIRIISCKIFALYCLIIMLSVCMCYTYHSNLPEIQVYENITIGTVILSDLRNLLGIPASGYMKLGPGSLTQYFRLDNHTGSLISTALIDLESKSLCDTEKSCCPNHQYEQMSIELDNKYSEDKHNYYSVFSNDLVQEIEQCKLMSFILASTNNDAQISPIAKLYVNILDLNDNPPQFDILTNYQSNHYQMKSIHLSFLEGPLGVGTKHDLPRAFDADFSPENQVKNYWIEWDNINQGIHNDAYQTSTFITSSKSSVISGLTSSNDQIWSKLGPFRLIYSKNKMNLLLQLDHELDHEDQSIYRLRLFAQDGGNLCGSIQLIIEVDDVNEFPPVFIDSEYTGKIESFNLLSSLITQEVYKRQYKVKESLEIGSQIGQLKAIDHDLLPTSGIENKITYQFSSTQVNWDVTHIFNLDSNTGILTLKNSLDYESVKSYRLTIIAQDSPSGKSIITSKSSTIPLQTTSQIIRSATALIDITVLDVNDNPPVILFEKDYINLNQRHLSSINHYFTDNHKPTVINKPYEIWIKENIPKGTPIVFFNVMDRDTGVNSQISCQLLNWTEKFNLRELSGLYGIETLSLLDREHTDKYFIILQCNDMGEPMLYNSKSLIIHLIDVNDLPPSFPLNVYQFRVAENSQPGTLIRPASSTYPTVVSATDPDLNSSLRYRLEPSEMKSVNNESINSNYIIHSLDYQLFSIDPITGQIYTQGELDREQRSRLEFRVCADDGLHSTCTNVIVDLEDVNDNLPRFERDTYVVRLEENKQYYKPILLFTVSDLDSGNNGFKFNFLNDLNEPQLTIQHLTSSNNTVKQKQRQRKKQIHHDTEIQINKSISQNFENINESGLIQKYFILRENGLYLQHTLDREEHANYHFYVQVHDLQINSSTSNNTHWNHVLTSQAEIFIDVTDVNDNIPIFIFPNITAPTGNRLTVSCHERMGSSIGQIQGYDPDLGLNGTITYTLILTPSDTEQLFHLDNISGELFVNTDQLNNRCGTSIILIISIDDQGPSESKISRHIPMERLIVQLEDKPTISELLVTKDKHQQSDKHWRFGSDDIISNSDVLLRDPGRLGSISKSDSSNTESGMQKIIATSTFSAKTVLSIILGGSTIFLIGLLITSTILLMYNRSKRQKTLINFKQLYLKKDTTDNCNSSNSNCITAEDGLMIGGQQDELTKILFPSNISPDEHIMQTAEYHPTYTMKNSSVNDNNNDEDDDDQGNVTVHSHSCYPHGTNTMMGLHQCAYDPNSINNTEFNDTVNGNYTAYPSTRLPNFIVASQCFGHSSSIMSAQSSSGSSQQQKEQRQLLQRHPSPVCVQRQQVYAKEKLFSNTNANCTVSLAYIIPSWETEQSSVTSQQHQQIPPIPVRLNKKSLYEYKMKQHENDCGKFGQNQQIWENNDKYCNTQNYQHISRTSLEKPPSGRPSSRCLVNNSASKVSHPHNKSSSPVRISKNVNFIPSMPRFHNYPLRKILDNTDYTVNNTCFNSTSQNYELCDHQHLYQFKSNPNILAYTTTIEHTHPNDSSIISQKNQSVNGYSAINNEQNHLLQQYHQPPPPYRFLTPPCTRRFTQFNYHLKSLPINQRNEGYTTLIREKQCSCTTAPVKKPITSPILKKLELLPSIDGKNLDNDNSSNQIERQEPPCCEYMSNYESEICSQCQLINMRNSPTPPFQSIPNLMTTDKMNEHISTTTINVTATGVNGSHSAISTIDNNTLYCINNCPLLNFCNDTTHQQEQYEHSSHHLNYSTMQDMYNSCV